MLFAVIDPVTREIGFDNIFETSIVAQKAQLDDMVTELIPLHALITVDVDLLEEVDECQRKLHLQLGILLVVFEVLKHHRDKLIQLKPFFLFLKLFLDLSHFLAMQHLQDLIL